MKKITVFTPTYNRAYCLGQLYESMLRQTSKDFEWLIIDDGSNDNTKKLVAGWIAEGKILINYHYKENGGMHTAHNVAFELIKTELNVCIDSDDYLMDDAIEIIIDFWNRNSKQNIAGILGLNCYKNGKIVSSKKFPSNIKYGKYSTLKSNYNIVGDVKFIYKTGIIKKYPPYPIFKGEKFVPLGYKYRLIDIDYDMLFLNKKICVVEYLEDGSTKNILKQYYNNPKGFSYSRLVTMDNMYSFKDKFFQTVHFIAESFLAKNNILKNNNNKIISIFAIPFGVLLYFYILIVNKK
ncbi:glycosyltransferase family 2 protein [Lutibacter sp.]